MEKYKSLSLLKMNQKCLLTSNSKNNRKKTYIDDLNKYYFLHSFLGIMFPQSYIIPRKGKSAEDNHLV